MTITSVSVWHGGDDQAVAAAVKAAKTILLHHGAERHEFSIVHAGPNAGHWIVTTHYRNWEAFGKAMQHLSHDGEFHAVLAQMASICQLTSHQILASLDL
jgi:hypothetical protein